MHILLFLISLFLTCNVSAQLRFENLNEKDVEKIMKDITSLSAHTSVSSSHSINGTDYALEVGVMGSYAQTPDIDKFVADSGGEDSYDYLPVGNLMARLGVADLITIEALFLPKIDVGEYNVSSRSLAIQLLLLEYEGLALGAKAYRGYAEISYEQLVDAMTVDVDIEDSFSGWQSILGYELGDFIIYLGYGVVSFDGDMKTSGDATIFDVNLSSTSSVDVDGSSNHYIGGIEYTYKKLRLGLEASKLFNNDRYSAKVTFLNIF
ncbi:MAG: hypothetical protein KC478_08155 [Bacteriovoracaceae bacterium]|nr:hypothetical protein [Bacteriovoracaceae bacterium]